MSNENANPIEFSVVIPIEGRSALLKKLLESLKQAIVSVDIGIEIQVIDSSDSHAASEIQDICKQFGANYYKGSPSVRKKRNLGARMSKNPFLLFLDSDCEVSCGLFVAYFHFIQNQNNQSILIAAAGPTKFQGGETFFTRIISESGLLSPFSLPENKRNLLWATTSNFLVSKRAFDLVGGFCEDFPFLLGGDDTDLGLRLHQIGCKIQNVPMAFCSHSWQTWSSPKSVIKRSFRWGWMQSTLLHKHRDFRRLAYPGLPVYFFICLIFSLIAGAGGLVVALCAPVGFLLLAVLIHALFSALSQGPFLRTFISDLILALVECPFGFGKAIGSLASGNISGIIYRIGIDDSEMDQEFPEIVRDLWSNNISILVTIVLIILTI